MYGYTKWTHAQNMLVMADNWEHSESPVTTNLFYIPQTNTEEDGLGRISQPHTGGQEVGQPEEEIQGIPVSVVLYLA